MPKHGHRYPESDRRRIYASRTGPRPHLWSHGTCTATRAQARAFSVAACQARFRGEPFELTFTEYCAAWGTRWAQRGRASGGLCLTRINSSLPWRADNLRLMTRGDHARRLK
jgi:hypothetical protein